MTQTERDSGPLHHAAVHVVAVCLLGWLTLLSAQRWRGEASGDSGAGGVVPAEVGQLLKIQLNDATANELELLPSIGPNMAARVLRHRRQHGDFESWSDLQQVVGLGPATIEAIRPYCELDRSAELSRCLVVRTLPASESQQAPEQAAFAEVVASSTAVQGPPMVSPD